MISLIANIEPRFEFRTFGRDLEEIYKKMELISQPVPDAVKKRISSEIYILTRTNQTSNCKIRDNKIDIKSLLEVREGLEQWNPVLKMEFPILKNALIKEIFPSLWTRPPLPGQESYTLTGFLDLVIAHPDLQSVKVDKERFGFFINNTICEYAKVFVNGALIHTVSTESTIIDDVKKTIMDVGILDKENINYQEAIKSVIGWSDKIIQ